MAAPKALMEWARKTDDAREEWARQAVEGWARTERFSQPFSWGRGRGGGVGAELPAASWSVPAERRRRCGHGTARAHRSSDFRFGGRGVGAGCTGRRPGDRRGGTVVAGANRLRCGDSRSRHRVVRVVADAAAQRPRRCAGRGHRDRVSGDVRVAAGLGSAHDAVAVDPGPWRWGLGVGRSGPGVGIQT